MFGMKVLLGLLPVMVRALAQNRQNYFQSNDPIQSNSEGPITLASLSSTKFTVLSHPLFAHHSVRIKRTPSQWCDSTVASYAGYIDTTGARHLFFFFFESRNEPDSDPVVLWTNGGPGASSAIGLFME